MINYRELDAAWWRWAVSQPRCGARGRVLERLADVPFPFYGTDWTVRREHGTGTRLVSIYVAVDGRILAPLRRRASDADETPNDGPK